MPTKKKTTKKAAAQKTFIEKVSDTASHIKDEIVTGKDHVVEFAGEAFGAIKEGVKHLVQQKKPKRSVKKKSIKKTVVKRTVKKANPKKAIKRSVKKSVHRK